METRHRRTHHPRTRRRTLLTKINSKIPIHHIQGLDRTDLGLKVFEQSSMIAQYLAPERGSPPTHGLVVHISLAVGTDELRDQRMLGKLGAASRTEAVSRARDLGLIP